MLKVIGRVLADVLGILIIMGACTWFTWGLLLSHGFKGAWWWLTADLNNLMLYGFVQAFFLLLGVAIISSARNN
jgi:hypothetical protein